MPNITAYESGAASIAPVSHRSSQWLHDQMRNCQKMMRLQPHRHEWYRGRRDAIRTELTARAQLGRESPKELDRCLF